MAWPTSGDKANTDHLDSGTDDPNQARPEILKNVNNVNSIIDYFPNGGNVSEETILFLSEPGGSVNYYNFNINSDPYSNVVEPTGAGAAKLQLATGTYLFECTLIRDAGNYDSNPFFFGGSTQAYAVKSAGGSLTGGSNAESYHFPVQKFTVSSTSTTYKIQFDSSSTSIPFTAPTNIFVKLTKIA